MDKSVRICQPRSRCRRWRECSDCAKIRQAKIANAAERLTYLTGALDWVTLSPTEAGRQALLDSRAEFLAATEPAGAVWTVEQSPSTGRLHCNILLPSADPARLTLSRSHIIHGITEPRRVAAYISKPEQFPDKHTYPGRLYGTAGPLWQFLASGSAGPVPEAAAYQHDLDAQGGRLPRQPPPPQDRRDPRGSLAYYREIAARHLPDLLAQVVQK